MNTLQQQALDDLADIRRHEDLREAARGNWNDNSRAAALFLARAIGYCRIWGVNAGDEGGSLPAAMLPQICAELRDRAQGALLELTHFEMELDLATSQDAVELLATTVLENRMDAWAMWIAIEERIQMLLQDEPSVDSNESEPLGMLLSQLMSALEQWDVDLQARGDLLALGLDPSLIDNWRAALAEPFNEFVPWWLDEEFWSEAPNVTVPNHMPIRMHRPNSVLAETPLRAQLLAEGHEFASPTKTVAPIGEKSVLTASSNELPFNEYEFHSCRDPSLAAKAFVQVPITFDSDGLLRIEIRFEDADREPEVIRLGIIIRLGAGAECPITMSFLEGQSPFYRCGIVLTRQQAEQLDINHFLRPMFGNRFWWPKESPSTNIGDS